MNRRRRGTILLLPTTSSTNTDQTKLEMQRSKKMEVHKPITNSRISSRERKLALLQDVDRLKKKLRHEENVHKALERAFTRPLGTLPRLPPYLPPYTLELLAEVAVLEEEVVRLEEQIVTFRKGLYQQAISISSSKKIVECPSDSCDPCLSETMKKEELEYVNEIETNLVSSPPKPLTDGCIEKENQSCVSSTKNKQLSPRQKVQIGRSPTKKLTPEKKTPEKQSDPQKLQLDCRINSTDNAEAKSPLLQDAKPGDDSPNAISENLLKCLLSIFLRISTSRNRLSIEKLPPATTLSSQESITEFDQLRDPYDICSEFEKRDIGPYKKLYSVDARSVNPNRTANYCLFLVRRLRILILKLASVNLQKLTHQEKLAFWINIYNSCIMNAFLEHGIPQSPGTVVALMQKATINVGGHQLNALTIEHFILRLPYHSKYTFSRGAKNDEMVARSMFGLELSEPLVTFALSCGSWSSPAVRIYTAANVENELEAAKRDYLQAAIGITKSNKLIIPKLLDWYLLDFAKDMESLLDWICLQLPTELRKEAMNCVQRAKDEPLSQILHIMPYEFSFRYLLHR